MFIDTIGFKCSTPESSKNKDYYKTIQDQVVDINTMSVVAMRSIGCGGASAKRFSVFINIPNPLAKIYQILKLLICQMKYVMLLMMK